MNSATIVLAVCIALASATTSNVVRAQAPSPAAIADARQHFQRGVKFYKSADFRSALVEFQEAYRLSPNYRLLFNIGQTFEELGDFAGAVKSFREYLAQGGAELSRSRRAEVEKDLARLEGHVAEVVITISEDGADVTLEGERRIEIGKSPITAAVLLNGGEWKVRAQKAGFDPAEVRMSVAGGDHKKMAITMLLTPPPAEQPKPVVEAPQPTRPPERSRAPIWVGVAVTGVLAVGTGVAGFVALKQKSNYDKVIDSFGSSPDDVSAARSKTRTWALATDVLGVATLATAAVTLVLVLSRSAAEPATKTGSLSPYLSVTDIGGGRPTGPMLGASGRF